MAEVSLNRTIEIATVATIAALAVDSFHKFVPSVAEVRSAKHGDKEIKANVHAGELIAGISVMTVSFLASTVAGNGLPIVIGGASFLAMCGTYEWLLHSQAIDGS